MLTIDELPVGTKLKFGAYSVSGETPHKIRWIKVHHDGTIMSEFIEDQLAFDAQEPTSPNTNRRGYGNNRYSVSNLRQFLNADYHGWYLKQHNYDEAPDDGRLYNGRCGYTDKPGFLHNFEEWEIDAIEESAVETELCNGDANELMMNIETSYDKVFIPSELEVKGCWDLFAIGDDCVGYFTKELYEHTDNPDKPEWLGTPWFTVLRTPHSHNGHCVKCVQDDGSVANAYADDDYLGIRPALKLRQIAQISEEPDDEGYYEVLKMSQEIIEIKEEEFFAILKIN